MDRKKWKYVFVLKSFRGIVLSILSSKVKFINDHLKVEKYEYLALNNIQPLLSKSLLNMWELASVSLYTIRNFLQNSSLALLLVRKKNPSSQGTRHPHLPILIQWMLKALRASFKSECVLYSCRKGTPNQAWERSSVWQCLSALPEAKRSYPCWPHAQCQEEGAILKSSILSESKFRFHCMCWIQ